MSQPDTNPGPEHSKTDAADSEATRSLAEWASLAIASVILVGIVGLAGYLWLGKPRTQDPPQLTVRQQGIRVQGEQFYVPFDVTNQGGLTVDSVQVIAELSVDGEVVESGEQQFQFLASDETESGAFVFSQNPSRGELVVRVASYSLP
ncbi:MAG: TIGR02588 family protein [Leptolyngbyaceae cyanobacterium SM1_1_3]|nr:TIGR02588 family protein [Leptolyngbyaceae cyanobacterium SM1_1_3]NJN02307.1 TIGR02588 family protein [Leptolyngbyaceae cyanobacterium RM1_1_2]NJO11412.1 TIGR02588 family protein [Leptolyngbyaceae cyanobacterium SL_1_1]